MTTENLDEKAGLPVGNNDNGEPLKGEELAPIQKVTPPKDKEKAKRPADNDNPQPPLHLGEKEEEDEKSEIDDKDEKKKVMEQEVPTVELSKDISELLDSIDFPAEFKDKALTIFEAAVAGHVADLHKVMLEKNEAVMETYKKELSEKVETASTAYMTEAVEKWVADNQITIKSNVRTQIAESFMANLIDLLETHYITVPEGKEDILDEALGKVDALQKQLDEKVLEVASLKEQAETQEKESMFESATKSLTDVQKERVATLAESIKSVSVDAYKTKLETIIESLTKETIKPSDSLVEEIAPQGVITEQIQEDDKYAYIGQLAKNLI